MTDRQEEASHGWWNQPDEVGTRMNRLMLRAWDLKEELSRVNREIEQWSRHLKALMQKREPIMTRTMLKRAARLREAVAARRRS